MRKSKILIIGIVVVIIIASVIYLFSSKPKKAVNNAPDAASAIPVFAAEADSRKVEVVLQQIGTLTAGRQVVLRSKAQGRVMEILFDEGTSVNKDQVLVRIDDAKIIAEIQNLNARINQLDIRLENKIRSLERNRDLVKQNLVSREMFDNLQTEIDEIKSQIVQTRASLSQLNENLADATVRAPFDGIAGPRNFSIGHYLRVGDPVVSIVDLNILEISFKVAEKYKTDLLVGEDVRISVDAHPGKYFNGKIFFIDPEVAIDTRTFLVKAEVENVEKALNPGMFARAELITKVNENAITVPWESVIQTETETYLYSIDGETAKKHPVTLGKIVADRVEIIGSSLSPGDRVILEGKFTAKDGAKVKILEKKDTGDKTPQK